jgi:hypothetical protein
MRGTNELRLIYRKIPIAVPIGYDEVNRVELQAPNLDLHKCAVFEASRMIC